MMSAAKRLKPLFDMRCCKCGRSLGKVKFLLNGRPIGPECHAKESGASLIPKRKRLSKSRPAKKPKFAQIEIERDTMTRDLFDDSTD